MWSPEQYRKFADERSRPFFDLLARVDADPRTVADLGCGPGDLTASLLARWPATRVWGVDSSAEMLARARALEEPGHLEFVLADLRDWEPPAPLDLVVSNATLQWLPDHEALVPRLAEMVAPGGTLTFGVPGNFEAPSHTTLAELRSSPRWRDHVGEGAIRAGAVETPAWYLGRLAELGFTVDAWETTYLHVLGGENAVLEWVRGTALRPVLAVLPPEETVEFLNEYGARLREAYPRRPHGTVLPFRRLFVVARRA